MKTWTYKGIVEFTKKSVYLNSDGARIFIAGLAKQGKDKDPHKITKKQIDVLREIVIRHYGQFVAMNFEIPASWRAERIRKKQEAATRRDLERLRKWAESCGAK